MPFGDDAPQFFAAGIQGISAEGPNLVLSFAAPIPNKEQTSREYEANVRVVMSYDSVQQMAAFLNDYFNRQQTAHQMPPIAH